MPHFALVTVDGESLGPVELGRPDWPDGSIIYRGDQENLRVVGFLPAEDTEHEFAVLFIRRARVTRRSASRKASLAL
jgi:hypothetical protein